MSIAERYEPFLKDDQRHLSRKQQRWPTLGWLLGEAQWYLIGVAGGTAAAIIAFALWLAIYIPGEARDAYRDVLPIVVGIATAVLGGERALRMLRRKQQRR